MQDDLPPFAEPLIEAFRAGTTSTFVLHGSVHDLVPCRGKDGVLRHEALHGFLEKVLFARFDAVLCYDRGTGLRVSHPSGDEEMTRFLKELLKSAGGARITPPRLALEVADRAIQHALYFARPARKVAVIIRYAELVIPAGEPGSLGGEVAESAVRLLAWAEDPTILGQNVVVCLLSERLADLARIVTQSPHTAKVRVPLPGVAEVLAYLEELVREEPKIREMCDVPLETVAKRLVGLPRVDVRDGVLRAVRNGKRLTDERLRQAKKELIEAECGELLELIESKRTLDLVAGLDAVKRWLREDAALLKAGKTHALPMGYLLAGRIGTGKTFLVTCWAGELGIPVVVLKNFRDRWVGATEGNLEKIFGVLRALGQCLVFVDEADQFAGKRGGGDDSGLSGRIYAALAQEMSDTRNRGKILWVFATSRPDLLEVDLKRQGRLDVHIPLFPPQTDEERRALMRALVRKLALPLQDADLPELPAGKELGGNELEGALVRAMRRFELDTSPTRRFADHLAAVLADMRPSSEQRRLELMDLLAVKECTDRSFLPPRYADLDPDTVDARIAALSA